MRILLDTNSVFASKARAESSCGNVRGDFFPVGHRHASCGFRQGSRIKFARLQSFLEDNGDRRPLLANLAVERHLDLKTEASFCDVDGTVTDRKIPASRRRYDRRRDHPHLRAGLGGRPDDPPCQPAHPGSPSAKELPQCIRRSERNHRNAAEAHPDASAYLEGNETRTGRSLSIPCCRSWDGMLEIPIPSNSNTV